MFLSIAVPTCRLVLRMMRSCIAATVRSICRGTFGALSTSLAQEQHRLRLYSRGVLCNSRTPRQHAALHARSELSSSSLMHVAGDVPESLRLPQDYCTRSLARRVNALY
jgi:hypothetical protein